MTIETATYISDLSASNPAAGDQKSEGDDHIRLVKSVLKTSFPSISGAVSVSHTKLNFLTDVTGNLQAQIDAKAPVASPAFTGTLTAVNGSFSGTLAVTGVVTLTTYATGVTESAGSNNTRLATTEFVQTAVASATGGANRAEMYFYGSF